MESDAIEFLLRLFDSKQSQPIVQESAAKVILQRLPAGHLHNFGFNIISKVKQIINKLMKAMKTLLKSIGWSFLDFQMF